MISRGSPDEEALVGRLGERMLLATELHLFTQPIEWDSLRRARRLAERVARSSDRIRVTIHDVQEEIGLARRARIETIPAFVLGRVDSSRIRYLGVPADRLFPLLLSDLLDLSRGDTGLEAETLRALREMACPLDLKVYAETGSIAAARMVRIANQFALGSTRVRTTTIVASDVPELADSARIRMVPTVVVNGGVVRFEGALPERSFLDQLRRAEGTVGEIRTRGSRRLASAPAG